MRVGNPTPSKVALWAVPALLIAQYVGNFAREAGWATAIYLVLFASCIWLPGPALRGTQAKWPFGVARASAAALAGLGGLVGAGAIAGLFSPHIAQFAAEIAAPLGTRRWLVITALAATWPVGLGLALAIDREVGPRALLRQGALVGVVFALVLVSGETYQGLALLPAGSSLAYGLLWGGAACLMGLAIAAPRRAGWWLAGLLMPALAVRGVGLGAWEIEPATRDMLALVTSAHDTFLAGENPYKLHQMQRDSVVPLTYLPGMWLSYLMPRLVGLDIRWMGVLADAVVVLSVWWVGYSADRDSGVERAVGWGAAAAASFGAVWLYLPSVHWNGIYAEPHIWWGVLAWLLASVALKRWWLAAVLLGLAVSTRHFGVVLLPFVLVAMIRDLGWRQLVPRLAVSGVVAAVLLVPFVAWDPETFWFGTFRWLREFGPVHETWFYDKFGFAGLFYRRGVAHWLPVAQVICVALCLLGAIFASRDTRGVLRWAGLGYLLFVMFNGLIWYSFFLGATLFVAVVVSGASVRKAEPTEDEKRGLTGARWQLAVGFLATSVAAGGWLIFTLSQAMGSAGLQAARGFLVGELGRGDVLIDESDWRVEFVRGTPLFGQEDRPGGVRVVNSLDALGARGLRALSGRVWVIARPARSEESLDAVERLGEVVADRRFGMYRVIGVRAHGVEARLSEEVDRLEPFVEAPSADVAMTRNPEGMWVAPGQPRWLQVGPKVCEVGGRRRPMLYVHPKTGSLVRLRWEGLPVGDHLVVFAGLETSAVVWDRGPVDLKVSLDGEVADIFSLANLPGLRWRAVPTGGGDGRRVDVEITVEAVDDRQRWVCLDGVVMRSDSRP